MRNPLAAIKSAAYFLGKKQGDFVGSSGKRMLAIIDSSITHADKIINDLLDYSEELSLDFKKYDPRTILDVVLSKAIIPENIKLLCQAKNEPTLCIDPTKIERAFLNIIKNAVDAMPNGGALKVRSQADPENVDFIFSDTGKGIPPQVMTKLFTPLFTTKAKGMGFGLAISKRIIEAHGGKISLTSKIEEGTTVIVSLPIRQKESQEFFS